MICFNLAKPDSSILGMKLGCGDVATIPFKSSGWYNTSSFLLFQRFLRTNTTAAASRNTTEEDAAAMVMVELPDDCDESGAVALLLSIGFAGVVGCLVVWAAVLG